MSAVKVALEDRHVLTTARAELAAGLRPVEAERGKIAKLEAAHQKCERDFEMAKVRGSAASPATARILRESGDRAQLIDDELAERRANVEELSRPLRGKVSHTCRVLQSVLGAEVEKQRIQAVRAFRPFFTSATRAGQLAVESDVIRMQAQFIKNLQPSQDELATVPDAAAELLAVIDTLLAGKFEFPALR